jgi:hypothetical protein
MGKMKFVDPLTLKGMEVYVLGFELHWQNCDETSTTKNRTGIYTSLDLVMVI